MIKNNLIKSILFITLVFYFGCNGGGQEPEALSPIVSLSVSSSSILVGESTILNVNVADIKDLYAISFELMFDQSILEIDMESGAINFLQFTGDNFGPVIYSDDGVLSFVLGSNNIDGKIYSVTIQGKQAGTTNVTLGKVNLIQEDGMAVFNYSSLILENVEITVTPE